MTVRPFFGINLVSHTAAKCIQENHWRVPSKKACMSILTASQQSHGINCDKYHKI